MKFIFWGLLISIIGALGWVGVVIFGVLTLGTVLLFQMLSYVFGALLIFGLPIGIVCALIQMLFKKKTRN